MAKEETRKETSDIRERLVRLEVKVEELSKRVDGLVDYAKDLYSYLQKSR